MTLFGVQEIGEPLRPCIFILNKYFNKLLIIFQLRIDHLYILFVLTEKIAEVLETLLNTLGQAPHCLRLGRGYASINALGSEENLRA
jgi:hypothetical protein